MVGHADERTTLGNYCFDRNTEVEKANLITVHEMVGHADERTTLGNYCFDRNTEVEKANLIEKASAC